MTAREVEGDPMRGENAVATGATHKVSRRRLMQESVLTAGAIAVASGVDRKDAMAQDESTLVAPAVAGRVLDFDVPGLEIGVAAYPEIPTGCTVFNFDVATFPDGVMLELDVRGGAPWHSGADDIVNAISLAGG
jgi:hypothetical protein